LGENARATVKVQGRSTLHGNQFIFTASNSILALSADDAEVSVIIYIILIIIKSPLCKQPLNSQFCSRNSGI
jgi:hypothetical protein